MATRTLLQDSSGNDVTVEEGEVCKVVVDFEDYDNASLAKASLITLTCTLRNAEDASTINSRSAQSVLDANGGTVAADGTLTLILDESDNDNIGGMLGGIEEHWLDFTWTWNDGTTTRTGKAAYKYNVRIMDSTIVSDVAWVG